MYKHILWATDLTHNSCQSDQKVLRLVEKFNADLSIVHVVEPVLTYGSHGFTDLQESLLQEAKKELQALCNILGLTNVDQHVEMGSITTQVLEVAEKLKVDLILVGSHGRYGLSRVIGSSASAILHGAQCDVLVIRADN